MSSLKNNLKKIVIVLTATVCVLFIAVFLFFGTKHNIMFWEHPKNLSDTIETIDVSYITWACDCANWLPLPRKNPDAEILDTDCIFIEPASPNLEVPDSYWQGETSKKKVRLTGSYYKTKGIPSDYSMNTDIKPDKALVFRYTKIEIVNR